MISGDSPTWNKWHGAFRVGSSQAKACHCIMRGTVRIDLGAWRDHRRFMRATHQGWGNLPERSSDGESRLLMLVRTSIASQPTKASVETASMRRVVARSMAALAFRIRTSALNGPGGSAPQT